MYQFRTVLVVAGLCQTGTRDNDTEGCRRLGFQEGKGDASPASVTCRIGLYRNLSSSDAA